MALWVFIPEALIISISSNLNAEISFLISLTSSSVTPSFSAFRCSWVTYRRTRFLIIAWKYYNILSGNQFFNYLIFQISFTGLCYFSLEQDTNIIDLSIWIQDLSKNVNSPAQIWYAPWSSLRTDQSIYCGPSGRCNRQILGLGWCWMAAEQFHLLRNMKSIACFWQISILYRLFPELVYSVIYSELLKRTLSILAIKS